MATARPQVRAPSTWFVSGLADEVDEGSLLRHFERIDRTIKAKSVNVLRNHQTFKSRGVAVVEFETPEDGDKAHAMVNYTDLLGKELQLTSYRPGGIRDRVTGNVFVKNLPGEAKSKDLYDFFSPYGKIFSCRAKYNSTGLCKGYGYVQFDTKEAAEKAIAEANGKEIKGTKIEVCPFKAREARNSSITMYNNLFVKNIPKNYTNDELKSLFVPYGDIVSAVVIKDRADASENRGFGFVCFRKAEDAKVAEEKLKNFLLEGQTLYVCRALTKEEHRRKVRDERLRIFKDCNVYVKNLPDEVNDESLKKAFEIFGQVLSARVMLERRQDPTTDKVEFKSKNFGFVCFSNKEEAKKAIAEAPTQQIFGRTLYVAIAEKKEDRISKLSHGPYPPMPMGWVPPHMYHGFGQRPRRMPYDNRRQPGMRPHFHEGMYSPYMMPPMQPGMGPMIPPPGAPMPPPYMPPYQAQPAPRAEPQPSLPTDKEQLGEQLYPLVELKDDKNAAKITGMLLEMEVDQIHNIIRDPTQLDKWIAEALKVLNTTPSAQDQSQFSKFDNGIYLTQQFVCMEI
eukprot:TRINITY_DN105101_c2_g1_i1.p1 TRINITY_DN105101_c2_g1~~TRINITY_DN105101_c2_g1_i1.p1  ORF type:complete len:637 (+),score=55.87 TRINITY_DN105101_c2_g1_i1:218-1912(+)